MFDTTHTVKHHEPDDSLCFRRVGAKHKVYAYRLAESLVRNTASVCLELNYRLLKPKFTIRTTSCNSREPNTQQLLKTAKEISKEQQVLDFASTILLRTQDCSLCLQALLYDQVLWRLCVLGKLNHTVWDTLFSTVIQRTIKELELNT